MRAHLSHLFKWRGVRAKKKKKKMNVLIFVRNIAAKRERGPEEKSL